MGRDIRIGKRRPRRGVSIHAPRVGRDHRSRDSASKVRCFNPRAPCGARHPSLQERIRAKEFQSTRPVRGATKAIYSYVCTFGFQSTRPVRGATTSSRKVTAAYRGSIPAPHAGRDFFCAGKEMQIDRFNPRALCGARRKSPRERGGNENVSIHAPRAGRD